MDSFYADFTKDIARGVSTRFLHQQTVPQARWLEPAKLAAHPAIAYDPTNPGRKIMVGALGEKLIGIDDNRHMMTVAGSRTGKSVSLVANLMFYPGSVLALDPKGELANLTARRRADLGQTIHVLDPFHSCGPYAAAFRKRYNPLAVLNPDSETIIEDAGMIADALIVPAGKDPHWDESARNFLEGLILHVATAPQFEGQRTLIAVRSLLRDALLGDEGEDDGFALELGMFANAERLQDDPDKADIAKPNMISPFQISGGRPMRTVKRGVGRSRRSILNPGPAALMIVARSCSACWIWRPPTARRSMSSSSTLSAASHATISRWNTMYGA